MQVCLEACSYKNDESYNNIIVAVGGGGWVLCQVVVLVTWLLSIVALTSSHNEHGQTEEFKVLNINLHVYYGLSILC